MVRCPHCQAVVDETAQSACPICFAPLGTQPVAPAPWAQQPGARVSLTGEVVQAPAPIPAAPTGSYAPQPVAAPGPYPAAYPVPYPPQAPGGPYAAAPMPMPQPIPQPMPPASAVTRPGYAPARPNVIRAQERPRSSALWVNLGVALFLVLCGAGLGWWKWTHRTNPKSQVERYVHAIQWLDWGVVYDLSAVPPGNKTRSEFIDMMDAQYDNNGVLRIVGRHANEKIQCRVGEPAISGDTATVPVTIMGGADEAGRTVDLKVRNFGGIWKVYPISANPLALLHGTDEDVAKPSGGSVPSIPAVPGAGVPGLP